MLEFFPITNGGFMKKLFFILIFTPLIALITPVALAEEIDVLIKGVDDGVTTNKQQDYKEAVMNAKLQAIERAGVEISSITKVVNFKLKFDMVESKAEAILLPGFQVMDLGYQQDGTYQVVLSGRVRTGGPGSEQNLEAQKQLDELGILLKERRYSLDKQIAYYEAFISDWSGTPAVDEARLLLEGLRKKQRELERKLPEKTGLKVQVSIKGKISGPLKVGPNWIHHTVRCSVKSDEIKDLNLTKSYSWQNQSLGGRRYRVWQKKPLPPQEVILNIEYGMWEEVLPGEKGRGRWSRHSREKVPVNLRLGQMTYVYVGIPIDGTDLGNLTTEIKYYD